MSPDLPTMRGGRPREAGLLGYNIDGYLVESVRGTGGFATVYRASRPSRDGSAEPVALKVLHPHLATSPGMRRRFVREINTVRRLDHPNIVRILGVGQVEGLAPYFAMEWLDGVDLDQELSQRGSLPVRETVALLRQVCDGLAAAHDAKVVHRDLKAANLILVSNQTPTRVKIVDFGIAKAIEPLSIEDASTELTEVGTSLGSPHCMAPEQIGGGPVGPAVDIYAIGVLMFRMLTGNYPFVGADPSDVLEQHLRARVPLASDFAPVSAVVDALIRRCMHKSPDRRLPHVAALAEALEHIDDSTTTDRRPAPQFVAVHVAARETATALDSHDEFLDPVEQGLEACEAAWDELGLVPQVDSSVSSGTLDLAVAALPPGGGESLRATVINRTLDLARSLATEPGATFEFTVHAGRESASADGTEPSVKAVSEWVHPLDETAVVATAAALRGIEDQFVLEPAQGPGKRFRVVKAVSRTR